MTDQERLKHIAANLQEARSMALGIANNNGDIDGEGTFVPYRWATALAEAIASVAGNELEDLEGKVGNS